MSELLNDPGRLVATHRLAPAFMQRAVFVALLSFVFFLATMAIFYLRQNFIYFLLSTSFLLVYLATIFSWLAQRKNVVRIFENGIEYRKFSAVWSELSSVERVATKIAFQLVVKTKTGRQVTIPSTIHGIDEIERSLKARI